MKREDIIRMAREAGATKVDAEDPQCWVGAIAFETDELERFAALVAAAEREAGAKTVEIFDKTFQTGGGIAGSIRARGNT